MVNEPNEPQPAACAISFNPRWYWSRVGLFDGVDESARDLFLRHTTRRALRKGQHVFRADDEASQVFYLAEGMVRVYDVTPTGELTIFWYCVSGELFGAGGITGAIRQSVNAQAISPCVVHSMPRSMFEQMLKLHAPLAVNSLKLMGARLRLACDTILDMRSQKTPNRVARALLRIAHNCGSPTDEGIRLDAPITHQEIGNIVGSCRQTVTEVLKDLEQRGLIMQRTRQITIVAPDDLLEFAGADDV